MAEILIDDWSGCYKEGWKGMICDESFVHPAKFSRALIRQILDHVIAEKWVAAGDSVVDPFGGVALGGFDAMRCGLHWYGCELEARFHLLGNQNIALWNERYSRMPQWGSATLLNGDSRKLTEVLSAAECCVSSPPYVSGGHHTDVMGAWNVNGGGHGVSKDTAGYGATEGQLGAMKEGDLNLSISSPPYAGSLANAKNYADPEKAQADSEREFMRNRSATYPDLRYGDTPGNLGAMPEGQLAITSPPYNPPMSQDHNGSKGGTRGTTPSEKGAFVKYGNSEGQLEGMSMEGHAIAITSPPFLEGRTSDRKQSNVVEDQAVGGATEHRTTAYGNSDGNLAKLKEGDVDIVISSPPYPQPYTSGGGINKKGYGDSFDKVGDRTYQSKGGDRTEGNLETLDAQGFDVAIASPPFEDSLDRGVVNKQSRREYARAHDISNAEHVSPIDMESERLQEYGETPGQLGRMKGGFDATVSSPPYEGLRMDGGKIAKEQAAGMRPYSDDPVDAWFTTRDQANIANNHPETFWSASRTILEQLYQVLTPGAHAVFVVKRFVRGGKIIDLPDQWRQLCEAVGFRLLHDHHAMLTEDYGTQQGFEPEDNKNHIVARKSFFRRLHEKKNPGTEIDWENVLCFVKPL